jgi:hypothetical protein
MPTGVDAPVDLRRAVIDQEHLKLLTIGYWVSAGWDVLFSLGGIAYMLVGVFAGWAIANTAVKTGQAPPPDFLKYVFGAFGLAFFLLFVTLAILRANVARSIGRRRSITFC